MARKITLTKDFDESVEVVSNQTGVFSPIIRVTVPRSRLYRFLHNGDLILKLAQTGGAEIAQTSQLLFTMRRPTERSPRDASGTNTYTAWRNIPLEATSGEKTQYDLETSARRRISFLSGSDIELPQEWIMEVLLKSTDAVDWDEVGSHFELTVVESDVATQVAQ